MWVTDQPGQLQRNGFEKRLRLGGVCSSNSSNQVQPVAAVDQLKIILAIQAKEEVETEEQSAAGAEQVGDKRPCEAASRSAP